MNRYILLALPLLMSCGPIKITPPGPDPTPPPVNCLVMLCPEGEHCEQGIGCVKDPLPDPPLECKPGEIPVIVDGEVIRCDPAPVVPCSVVESQLEGVPEAVTPVYGVQIAAAMAKLGDPSGKPPQETLGRLAASLKESGPCAFAGQEAVFILRPDGLYEEWHAVYFGDGSWTNGGKGKYMLCHRVKAGPPPTDPPPPANGCPAEPCPKNGPHDWKLKCKPHGKGVDCTPTTVNQEPFCRAIGMSPMADGTLRAGCPMRPDGHPEREAVERWVTGGTKLEGPACEFVDGNPFQFYAAGGKCRLCSADGQTCGGFF